MRLWLFQLTGEGLTGRGGEPRAGSSWRATSTDAAKTSSQPAPQGKPGKDLSPNFWGGSFPGRRQTAATPLDDHQGEQPAIVQNRQKLHHSTAAKDRQRLRPAMHTPDDAGTGTGHVSRFSPGFVYVSGSASRPAPAGIRGRLPQLPESERTPGPTRAHSGPRTAPCANGNTPPATQSVHAFRTASPANVNGIAGPGAFYYSGRIPAADRRRRPDRITGSYTKCKPAEPQPVCTGAPARVCPWAVRALLFV